MREPCAVKVARTVLRGEGSRQRVLPTQPITAAGSAIAISNAPGQSASVHVRDFKIFTVRFADQRSPRN